MVIWSFFPCFEGGAERQCRKLVSSLSKQGYSCVVLTSRLNRDLAVDEVLPEGYRVRRLGQFAWTEGAFRKIFRKVRSAVSFFDKGQVNDAVEFWLALPFVWLSRLCFMFALRSFLRKNEEAMDVLHVHEAHWIAGAVGWAASGLGLPVVCKEADYPAITTISYDTPLRSALAQYRQQVNFIAMTEAIARSLEESSITADRITRIPNGVLLPAEQAVIQGKRDLVYIGNFTQGAQRKAFDILFEAWVQVQQQEPGKARLVMLGAGAPEVWQEYLAQHNCLESVFFAGAVEDVGLYLQQARLFLLPSRVEGLSNALLEAMSWGVPVVVSDIPANRSLVCHQENGYVVPVGDSTALAAALIKLLNDEELSLQLGTAARQTIEKEYIIDQVTGRLLNLYGELIERNRQITSSEQ